MLWEELPDLSEVATKAREAIYNTSEDELEKPLWLVQRIEQFKNCCREGETVFWDRGAAYGDATAETGLMGAAITLTTDVARLRGIVLNLENLQRLADGDEELKQKLRDALIDAHNYACICLHWLDAGNLLGRPNYE